MHFAIQLFITMLGLGLGLTRDSLNLWLRQPAMAVRVALGSSLLVPLLGVLLLHGPWSGAIAQPIRVAMALMALCPSAPLAIRTVRRQGGDHALAALVQVMAAIIAMVSIPLLAPFFPHAFDRGWLAGQVSLTLQTGWEVALQVARVQVLPLLLGLALRRRRPALADRLEKPLNRIAALLLLPGAAWKISSARLTRCTDSSCRCPRWWLRMNAAGMSRPSSRISAAPGSRQRSASRSSPRATR